MFSRGNKRGNSGYNVGVKKTMRPKHLGNKGVEAGKLSFSQSSPNMANGLQNNSNDASMVYEPVKEHVKSKKQSRPFLVEKPKKKESEMNDVYA
jgi:hypothetical protein